MKPITEVYPKLQDETDGYWWDACDYQPMIESMWDEIAIQVDDRDYQGDSRILFRDGERFGILVFGWGSCSGCDALQACVSVEEIEELRQNLCDKTMWFDTAEDCLSYIEGHDWEGDYCWHADETREFVKEAKELLTQEIAD